MNHTISLAANLKHALMTEPMLRQQYKRVNVLVTTSRCTTVPVALFKAEEINDIFTLNFPKESLQHITYNILRRSGVALVFGIDKRAYQLILDDFPRARFYTSASTLIELFCEKSQSEANKKMYVYLHEKEMSIYIFDRDLLVFLNSYVTNDVSNMQYYALNVWQQMEMDQIDDSLYVVGDNDQREEFANKMQYFINNVTLINRKDDFRTRITNGYAFLPYDLQTLLICGF